MPELAEVEFYRRKWDAAIGQRIRAVELHARKRIFRETNTRELVSRLVGARLISSHTRGKQMLFHFSGDATLGIHLGMSGALRVEPANFEPDKHDHLVLRQRQRALVFRDPRQFGRVRFHHGDVAADWMRRETPEISDRRFDQQFFDSFLQRHRRAPIKAVLLLQSGFSGIGNWMADEILWRAKIRPNRKAGALNAARRSALLRETRFVARESLRVIGREDRQMPKSWLIHERWSASGKCPRDKTKLRRATIGGRTTAWCVRCQR
jgi:formamidopyrimidine-DNA glycosylase